MSGIIELIGRVLGLLIAWVLVYKFYRVHKLDNINLENEERELNRYNLFPKKFNLMEVRRRNLVNLIVSVVIAIITSTLIILSIFIPDLMYHPKQILNFYCNMKL